MAKNYLSIVNELLSGKTINTNANWLGDKLTKIGCRVYKQVVVPDEEKPIINALNFLVNDKEGCIIVTGGLGPTDDDITRDVLFKYVKTESKFDLNYWNKLSKRFKSLGIDIPESNRSQALVPQNGDVIDNSIGSARGFKFKIDNSENCYVSPSALINVDHSMEFMMEETFGPTVGIMKVKNDDEAEQLMNDSPYGLTASIWTSDKNFATLFGNKIQTGTFFMNRCDYLDPGLAWTGVKDTGTGVTLSVLGFDHLTRAKSYHLRKV